jgi:2-C-methyl-D-erythritol 4-phosphate cytidylyltransferase
MLRAVPETCALIVAAGDGTRMGPGDAKPFRLLAGRPILLHTLTAFERCQAIEAVVLVVRDQDVERAWALARAAACHKVARVVAGGPTRQASVGLGLAALPPKVAVVAVHDGVRPLVTPEAVARVVAAARTTGAALLATRVAETVKVVQGERVSRTLDRSALWLAQTPQAFRADLLRQAHAYAQATGLLATDDAALVEAMGYAPAVVEGSPENLKIATPDDLRLAEAILRGRLAAAREPV